MTVRVYRSTDFGAPQLSGQVGTLIAILNACLVDGYGTNTITSLTQSGGVATATTNVPHQFTGSPKVLIAGAASSDYNVEATITITGASTFTYPVNPAAPGTAGGAPTCKIAGSGWTKPFADGTYVAAYKQPAGSNGFYLRVDDNSSATVARGQAYETMTNVSSGLTPFPTSAQLAGGVHIVKSDVASSATRPWMLVCNGPFFVLFIAHDNNATWTNGNGTGFGDIKTYKAGGADPYGTVIIGNVSNSFANNVIQSISNSIGAANTGHWIARPHTGVGGSATIAKTSDYTKTIAASSTGTNGQPYPSPVDGGLYVSPLWLSDASPVALRGELPGLWNPLHQKPLANGDIWAPGSGSLVGKTFEAVNLYSNAQIFVETSDTW
mgnify:FL=1